MARAPAHELDHRRDRVVITFEHALRRPVGAVAGPAGDAAALRLPARRVAEEDALDAAVGDHSAAR